MDQRLHCELCSGSCKPVAHIFNVHINQKLLKCRYCAIGRTHSRKSMLSHLRRFHANRSRLFTDARFKPPVNKQYRSLYQRCFGRVAPKLGLTCAKCCMEIEEPELHLLVAHLSQNEEDIGQNINDKRLELNNKLQKLSIQCYGSDINHVIRSRLGDEQFDDEMEIEKSVDGDDGVETVTEIWDLTNSGQDYDDGVPVPSYRIKRIEPMLESRTKPNEHLSEAVYNRRHRKEERREKLEIARDLMRRRKEEAKLKRVRLPSVEQSHKTEL